MLKKILTPLASLRVTVALLLLSMLVIFVGTLAQRHYNINDVERKYFHCFVGWMDFKDLFARKPPGQEIGGGMPIPGGFTLGVLLLVNLISAHTIRFKLQWKRTGIILIHASLILLLVGEAIRATKSIERRMYIEEGSYKDYLHSIHRDELAIVERGSSEDTHVVIPGSRLRKAYKSGQAISDPNLPVQVKVEYIAENTARIGLDPAKPGEETKTLGTEGPLASVPIRPRPRASGVKGESDIPAAFVTFVHDGKSLGTYHLPLQGDKDMFHSPPWPAAVPETQTLKVGEKTYEVALRGERTYTPYRLALKKFSFDRYPGTETPLNFSSDVQLVDPSRSEDRPVRIWMNHPLRFAGETFFQSGYNGATEKATVLQVVHNPGWTMPYIACVIGGVGLCLHFGIVLVGFVRKTNKQRAPVLVAAGPAAAAAAAKKPGRAVATSARRDEYTLDARPRWMRPAVWMSVVTVVIGALYVASKAVPERYATPYDLETFGKTMISYEGRIQPLDSLARNTVRVSNGREGFKDKDGVEQPAVRHLFDAFMDPARSRDNKVFRIDRPDVIDALKLDPTEKRFSLNQIAPSQEGFGALFQLAKQAAQVEEDLRNPYQQDILKLWKDVNTLVAFNRLQSYTSGEFIPLYLVPPSKAGEPWRRHDEATAAMRQSNPGDDALPEPVATIFKVRDAIEAGKTAEANRLLRLYHQSQERDFPADATRTSHERFMNRFAPSYHAMGLYVFVFLIVCVSWLGFREPLQRSAFWLLAFAMLVHTFGIISRIYVSGRPPVTNLESAALLVGWGAALLALGIEYFFRNGIASAMGSAGGAIGVFLFYMINGQKGDSMAVMQAVLDTNFWLATHVVCITLGYATTMLAGLLGAAWVIGGLVTPSLDDKSAKNLTRMIYGVTCFAMLFSFIGTVLGGIWADQSWGRFWGWDPKENGAILVVLVNALLLHARWGGMVQGRGIAVISLFANIVTFWSFFGTNALGIGLHAYGFMKTTATFTAGWMIAHALLMLAAAVPMRYWVSFADDGTGRK